MLLRAVALALVVALLAVPAGAQNTKRTKPTTPAAPNTEGAPEAGAATPAADPVVAIVNGEKIHRSDIQEALRTLPPQRTQQSPDKLYVAVLDQMVATTLVAQAARKAKTQDEPEVKRRLALVQEQVLAQAYVDHLVKGGLSDAKLKALYEKAVKNAPPREEVNARHILLPTEAEAKAVIEQLKNGADFATLAKEKTTDPAGKASGGDLGWFPKEQMVPEFADAAFALKKGEFSQTPVQTKFGWHVIKVEDRRIAPAPTFDQLKPQLTEELARQLVKEKMDDLKTAAKIELFNGDGSRPGTKPATPPAAAAPPPPTSPEDAPPTLSPATKPKD